MHFLSFVNLLLFHYIRRNQSKADNTKSQNKLECEADLLCALPSTKPRIKFLVSKKQLHPSH